MIETRLEFWLFEFRICFGFRALNFEIIERFFLVHKQTPLNQRFTIRATASPPPRQSIVTEAFVVSRQLLVVKKRNI